MKLAGHSFMRSNMILNCRYDAVFYIRWHGVRSLPREFGPKDLQLIADKICITRLLSGERLAKKERMTTAAIEPAVSAGKPKRLLDQMRYIARESPAFVQRLPDYGVAGRE